MGEKVEIGDRAFVGCTNLEKLNFASTNYKLGRGVFNWCNKLADKDGFIVWDHVLYGYCGDGPDITVPDGITTISDRALYLRKRPGLGMRWEEIPVRSITLPDSVRCIDDDAFIDSDDADPNRGTGENLLSMRKRKLPENMNMPKDYLKQGKGAFPVNMAILLIEGPWKNLVTEDDYIAMYLNQNSKNLLALCEKKLSQMEGVFERLLAAAVQYNVNLGYEHVVEWANKNRSMLTAQQIDKLEQTLNSAKAKKAIKMFAQYF